MRNHVYRHPTDLTARLLDTSRAIADGARRMVLQHCECGVTFRPARKLPEAAQDFKALHDIDRVAQSALCQRHRRSIVTLIAQANDRPHPDLRDGMAERVKQPFGIRRPEFPFRDVGPALGAYRVRSADRLETHWAEVLHHGRPKYASDTLSGSRMPACRAPNTNRRPIRKPGSRSILRDHLITRRCVWVAPRSALWVGRPRHCAPQNRGARQHREGALTRRNRLPGDVCENRPWRIAAG